MITTLLFSKAPSVATSYNLRLNLIPLLTDNAHNKGIREECLVSPWLLRERLGIRVSCNKNSCKFVHSWQKNFLRIFAPINNII